MLTNICLRIMFLSLYHLTLFFLKEISFDTFFESQGFVIFLTLFNFQGPICSLIVGTCRPSRLERFTSLSHLLYFVKLFLKFFFAWLFSCFLSMCLTSFFSPRLFRSVFSSLSALPLWGDFVILANLFLYVKQFWENCRIYHLI